MASDVVALGASCMLSDERSEVQLKRAETGIDTAVGFEFEALGSDRIEPACAPDRLEDATGAGDLGEAGHDFPELAGDDALPSL